MAPFDSTSQANKDAAQVTNLDHLNPKKGGGPDSAYHALIADYNNYQRSGVSQGDLKAYWTQVTSDLTHTGALPDLSIAWAHDQLTAGRGGGETSVGQSIDKTRQNGFTRQDLTDFARTSVSGNPIDLPNATFAQSVADQFDNIPLNGVPPIFQPSGVASAGDLQAVENNTIATNEQITAIQAQAPLFANNGALLRSLDSAANPGGPLDGNVGNSDLKAWLSSYKLVTENGTITQPSGSPFTKANAQFVQDILNGKYNGQDEGLNSAGFQVDQLGKAGAYGWDQNFDGAKNHGQDYNDLVKSYSDRSASLGYPVASTSDAPAPTPAPTDSSSTAYKTPPVRNAAGQIAQITLNDGRKDSFTYDSNGDISQIEVTNSDGTTSTLKPDAKGVWNGLTADGKGVTDVAVSKDGHIVFKDSSGQFSTVLPGGATQVLSSADQATLKKALKPYQSTSVETGDGYLRVAARVLGIQDTDNSKVGALANELESALHNQVLQPNQVIDLSDIVDPYLHALMDNSEQNAINKINI